MLQVLSPSPVCESIPLPLFTVSDTKGLKRRLYFLANASWTEMFVHNPVLSFKQCSNTVSTRYRWWRRHFAYIVVIFSCCSSFLLLIFFSLSGGLTRIIQVPQYVQSVTVDSLNPDTEYLFAVSAGNQHGIGPLSEEMSGRTKAIIARIEPTKDTEVQSTSQEGNSLYNSTYMRFFPTYGQFKTVLKTHVRYVGAS